MFYDCNRIISLERRNNNMKYLNSCKLINNREVISYVLEL